DRGCGKRRRHVNHGNVRARLFLGFPYCRKNRDVFVRLARFLRVHAGDVAIRAVRVFLAHLRMELAGLAGDALRHYAGVLVDQNAHFFPLPALLRDALRTVRFFAGLDLTRCLRFLPETTDRLATDFWAGRFFAFALGLVFALALGCDLILCLAAGFAPAAGFLPADCVSPCGLPVPPVALTTFAAASAMLLA